MQNVRRAGDADRSAPITLNVSIRRAAIGLGVLLAVVVVGGYAYASAHADRVYPGVRAVGVPLDGLAPEVAQQLIAQRAGAIAGTRVQVRAGESMWSPTLGELGLQTDPTDLTRRALAIGRAGTPLDRGAALFGGLFAPTNIGGGQLARARAQDWVAAAAREHDRPAVDALLTIDSSGRVALSPEQVGRRLDQAGALNALTRALNAWADGSAERDTFSSILLPTETLPPRLTADDLTPARDQAVRALSGPIVLAADGASWTVGVPEIAAALRLDTAASRPSIVPDPAVLAAIVDRLAAEADRAPRDATLSIGRAGVVQYQPDVAGRRVDRAASAAELAAALKAGVAATRTLPMAQLPAAVRAEHLAAARAAAERALRGPLELRAGDKSDTLDTSAIAALLRVDGTELRIDATALRPRLEELAKTVDREPKHDRLMIEGGGKPPAGAVASLPGGGEAATLRAIEEGAPGLKLDVDAALALIGQRLTSGERSLALPTRELPAYTSKDRAALGKLELLEWSSTEYAGGVPERGYNIELAARVLNGVVVPPGETFSFNRATGPTTTDTGYKLSWGIIGGGPGAPPKTVPSVGGGICQVATTLFHAVFWSGFEIEERNWHLYWIPKYGAPPKGLKGLDATVDEPSGTDLQWKNNSAHPVVVQARTDGTRIAFGLYGTSPGWKVTAAEPAIDRYRPTSGETVEQREPSLPRGYRVKVEEARDGFRSTIVRTVTAADGQVRRAAFTSEYMPSRHVWVTGG